MNKTLITFFTVLFCLTSSVGYSQNIICEKTGYTCPEIDFKELVLRDGDYYYKKFSEVPFTGKTTGQEQGKLKNGLKEGSWVRYNENGQLKRKGDYKNGKREGSWVYYHDNGQLDSKGDYKNGKQEGSWFTYFQNGQLSSKGDFNNGKKEGSWVTYHYYGQLASKGDYKYGKKEGSWFRYLRDGTVNNKYTGTYKDGIKRRSY